MLFRDIMQESWNNTNAPGNGRRQGRDESGGKREVADRSALKKALFTNLGHPTSEKLINKTTQTQVPKDRCELLLLTNADSRPLDS